MTYTGTGVEVPCQWHSGPLGILVFMAHATGIVGGAACLVAAWRRPWQLGPIGTASAVSLVVIGVELAAAEVMLAVVIGAGLAIVVGWILRILDFRFVPPTRSSQADS